MNTGRSCRKPGRSLRGAWYQLQVLRILLEEGAQVKLPPIGRRKCFATEGALLADGLQRALNDAFTRFDELAAAAEALRPYLASADDGKFPGAVLRLNKALDSFLRPDSSERLHRAQRARERITALGGPPC